MVTLKTEKDLVQNLEEPHICRLYVQKNHYLY